MWSLKGRRSRPFLNKLKLICSIKHALMIVHILPDEPKDSKI